MRKLRPRSMSIVLMSGLVGCQVISAPSDLNAPSGGDDLIECVDPLDLADGVDYACGEEVVVVVVAGPEGTEFFLDTFTIAAQVADTNRFLLINELDVDLFGDVTVTIGGVPQTFEVGTLRPGELFPVNTECADRFVWGDAVDGLCLFEPL